MLIPAGVGAGKRAESALESLGSSAAGLCCGRRGSLLLQWAAAQPIAALGVPALAGTKPTEDSFLGKDP